MPCNNSIQLKKCLFNVWELLINFRQLKIFLVREEVGGLDNCSLNQLFRITLTCSSGKPTWYQILLYHHHFSHARFFTSKARFFSWFFPWLPQAFSFFFFFFPLEDISACYVANKGPMRRSWKEKRKRNEGSQGVSKRFKSFGSSLAHYEELNKHCDHICVTEICTAFNLYCLFRHNELHLGAY